ncbi:MAG: hypothetical protein PUB21_05070 [Bacteroidales bacterium]|nr:hypothetical protein [Bacteroidales bacterium]
MKRNFMKWMVASFAVAMVLGVVSCKDDEGNGDGDGGADPLGYVLKGELSGDRTLLADKEYTLEGGYIVNDGAKLIIKEGVKITAAEGNNCDYILVKQGGKLEAVGTAQKPIVLTAKSARPGAWGGIHICGKAPINTTGSISEIGDAPYGGNNANDNSGTLRYLRLEYTGYAFNEEKESNGLTLYGVGNGTTIEYVQAFMGADDGIEWFGGTVNAKYLVSVGNEDDLFDWTDGWSGAGQFWYGEQSSVGDCLIEADNNATNNLATPNSYPKLANVTLKGNGSSAENKGIRLRAGTWAKIYNTEVSGKANSIYVETNNTIESFLKSGNSLSGSSLINGCKIDNNINIQTNRFNAVAADLNITASASASAVSFSETGLTSTNYLGGVPSDSDWRKGWAKKLDGSLF